MAPKTGMGLHVFADKDGTGFFVLVLTNPLPITILNYLAPIINWQLISRSLRKILGTANTLL